MGLTLSSFGASIEGLNTQPPKESGLKSVVTTSNANNGNNIVTLNEEETQVWKDAAQPIYAEWLADMEGKGIDGQALIDEARMLMDAYDK